MLCLRLYNDRMIKQLLNKIMIGKTGYRASNTLEDAFLKAARNYAQRPELYRQMFHFNLIVLGKLAENGATEFITNTTDGKKCIYVYTSVPALNYASKDHPEPMPYIEMAADDLYPLLIQSNLGMVLNAGADKGKVFYPHELATILKSRSVNGNSRPAGSRIVLGQPKDIPHDLLSALKNFITRSSGLNDIYFGMQVANFESSYILALDTSEDSKSHVEKIVKDVNMIVKGTRIEFPVDILVANEDYKTAYQKGNLISCLK